MNARTSAGRWYSPTTLLTRAMHQSKTLPPTLQMWRRSNVESSVWPKQYRSSPSLTLSQQESFTNASRRSVEEDRARNLYILRNSPKVFLRLPSHKQHIFRNPRMNLPKLMLRTPTINHRVHIDHSATPCHPSTTPPPKLHPPPHQHNVSKP